MKFPLLQERIIAKVVFRLAIKVFPYHMNIPVKRQIVNQFSQDGEQRNG